MLAEWEFYGNLSYTQIPASGILHFNGNSITPAAPITSTTTGTINNYDGLTFGTIIFNNASEATLTGIVAGYNGQRISIISVGAGNVVISHQSGSSTAANRIITPTAASLTLTAGTGRADLIYDTATSRWRAWSLGASTAQTDILEIQVFS
jgi:hypothetical protein